MERSKPGLTPLVKILQEQFTKGNEPIHDSANEDHLHFCPDEWALLLKLSIHTRTPMMAVGLLVALIGCVPSWKIAALKTA